MSDFDKCRKSPNFREAWCSFQCADLNFVHNCCTCSFENEGGSDESETLYGKEVKLSALPPMQSQNSTVFQKCLNKKLAKLESVYCQILPNNQTNPRGAFSKCKYVSFKGPSETRLETQIEADDALNLYFTEEMSKNTIRNTEEGAEQCREIARKMTKIKKLTNLEPKPTSQHKKLMPKHGTTSNDQIESTTLYDSTEALGALTVAFLILTFLSAALIFIFRKRKVKVL